MTEAELADHETHAERVDSRMSERVLALVAEVRRLRDENEALRYHRAEHLMRLANWSIETNKHTTAAEPAPAPGRGSHEQP